MKTISDEKILKVLQNAEQYITEQMTEADELSHMFDAHDSDTCILCELRETITELTK